MDSSNTPTIDNLLHRVVSTKDAKGSTWREGKWNEKGKEKTNGRAKFENLAASHVRNKLARLNLRVAM